MQRRKAVHLVQSTMVQRLLVGGRWNLERCGDTCRPTEGHDASIRPGRIFSFPLSSSSLLEDDKNHGPSTSGQSLSILREKATARTIHDWMRSAFLEKRRLSTSSAQEQTTERTQGDSADSRDPPIKLLQHLPDSLLTDGWLEEGTTYMSKFEKLLRELDVDGEDLRELLLRALVHESYYSGRVTGDGESELMMRAAHATVRSHLEKLGDSVLSLAVVTELAGREVLLDSGATSDAKSEMVSNRCLADAVASKLLLGDLVLMGQSWIENEMGMRNAMADSVERIIGAIYSTKGINTALQVVHQKMMPWIRKHVPASSSKNPVGALQERAVAKFKKFPVYKFEEIRDALDGHVLMHRARVFVSGILLAEGLGLSRSQARRLVAEGAMRNPIWDSSPVDE